MLEEWIKPWSLSLTVTCSNDGFFLGYLPYCIDNIRLVSWWGEPALYFLQTSVCSHGVVTFSEQENVFLLAKTHPISL